MAEKNKNNPSTLKRLGIRRLVPLALLGSAVALVAVQLSKAVDHEVILQLSLSPELMEDLTSLELQISGPDDDRVASLVIFRFQPKNPRPVELRHQLGLIPGDYSLIFRLLRGDAEPVVVKRHLKVSADTSVRLRLP